MKKIIMLLLVNICWDSRTFAQNVKPSGEITIYGDNPDGLNTRCCNIRLDNHGRIINVVCDTIPASLLVTHNNRGIAHPHDGFVLTENGKPTGKYLDVNKQPINKPITVWYYELNVIHTKRKRHRASLCH